MLINLNKEELTKCQKLLDAKEYNMSAAELYIDFLENNYQFIDQKLMNKMVSKYGKEKAYVEAFKQVNGIDENDEYFKNLNKNSRVLEITKLSEEDFINDEYYKLLKVSNIKNDSWLLTNLMYLSYEGFVYDELVIGDSFFEEHTPIGYFEKEFHYPAIIEDDTIWMSIIPHEINTMKEHIEAAFGNVLVLGLGLGYYAYHVSNKEDVDKVTILEKDPRVIKIFKEQLLPLFKNKDKIRIIECDALEYIAKPLDYNYIFSDIWHNAGDGIGLYLNIKNKEKYNPSAKYSYWIETSLIAMFRRQILTVFEEALEGLKEDAYKRANNENDAIINRIYFALKNYPINSFNDLHHLLEDESLKELATRI